MALSVSRVPCFLAPCRRVLTRARGAAGVRARGGAAAGDDARCEVFSHPIYGNAMRARVAVPAQTMLLEEPPLLYGKPPARLEAVCDQVRPSDPATDSRLGEEGPCFAYAA